MAKRSTSRECCECECQAEIHRRGRCWRCWAALENEANRRKIDPDEYVIGIDRARMVVEEREMAREERIRETIARVNKGVENGGSYGKIVKYHGSSPASSYKNRG